MKPIILSILLFFVTLAIMAQGNDSVPAPMLDASKQVKEAYDNGEFQKMIELLEQEIDAYKDTGKESFTLYYNLGNAYYRANEVAEARLYYERALILNPGDRDTRHNINYLTTRIEDQVPVANSFILSRMFHSIQSLSSSNRWAAFGIVSFILLIACLVTFFFTKLVLVKKVAFYIGVILIVFITFANVFAYNQKKQIEYRDTAVIMPGSVSVYSSPDTYSKEIFILHSGTKVVVTKEDRNWLEIEIDNGSIGWVQRDKLEII